jgi:hypothetical protein
MEVNMWWMRVNDVFNMCADLMNRTGCVLY